MSGLVDVQRKDDVLHVALDRPDVRNALSVELVAELTAAFAEASGDSTLRAVVLSGNGKDFCAGADLGDMKRLGSATPEENRRDAEHLVALFDAIHSFPRPVVARVQGNVFGGGVGLAAASDVTVLATDVRFAFSEVRLGIIPAVISPYVVRRIGFAHARRLFLTGEPFDAEVALRIGLASQVVPREDLDEAVNAVVGDILKGSPDAQRRIKMLMEVVIPDSLKVASVKTPGFIADARASEEGQEGLAAFFERRRPSWIKPKQKEGS